MDLLGSREGFAGRNRVRNTVKRFRLRSPLPYGADVPTDLPIPPIEMRMLVGPTD